MVIAKKSNLIAALDIGTSKILCLIAQLNSSGEITVIGIGQQLSKGFKNGIITDIKALEKSIMRALGAAEAMSEENIENIVVSLSSSIIESNILSATSLVSGEKITDKDIGKLTQMATDIIDKNKEIVYCEPLEYVIDGMKGISDPTDIYGQELKADIHAITIPQNIILNHAHCLAKCHLNLSDFLLSSHATGLACLTEDELEYGVMLFDMGAGSTSFSVFSKGKLVYIDSIALGGMHITADIAHGLSINFNTAERIKTIYGNAIIDSTDYNSVVDLFHLDNKEELEELDISQVKLSFLSEIINARVEEIINLIKQKLTHSNILNQYLIKRIVISGGASQLTGLKETIEQFFAINVRLGNPKLPKGIEFNNLGFSSAIGILYYLADKLKDSIIYRTNNKDEKIISKLFSWIKNNF